MNSGIGAAANVGTTEAIPRSSRVDTAVGSVYEIDPLCDSRWAELVERHPRASVFHSTNWLKALQAVYGYDPVIVTSCPPESPLTNGIVFCRIKSLLTGCRFVSLPFSDHCEPLVSSRAESDDLLAHVCRQVGRKWKYAEIRPISFEPNTCAKFGQSATYCFHRLDLNKSTHELFRSFHKDCIQRKIHRAEREKLKYEEGTSEDLLQKFYRLLVMTRRRKLLPPQPLDWFRGLIAAFGEDLKIRVASKDGLPVASILTLSRKRVMTYKYGCSDSAVHKLGGMPLLLWNTVQEAKDRGFEQLDMGRSDTFNTGLIAFKEHWGAAKTVLRYWKYPGEPVEFAETWQRNLARLLVSAAPDAALKMAGKLLYRHIG
jgi:hypothetical protein